MLFWLTLSFVNIDTGKVEFTAFHPAELTYSSLEECRDKNREEVIDKFGMTFNQNGQHIKIVFDCQEKLINQ